MTLGNATPTCSVEEFAEAIERLENLSGALQLPLPPAMHVDQLRKALPDLIRIFKGAYVYAGGDDHWSTHP